MDKISDLSTFSVYSCRTFYLYVLDMLSDLSTFSVYSCRYLTEFDTIVPGHPS